MSAAAVAFFQRPYPSANSVLLRGSEPVLVDSGFGSDTAELEGWLAAQGTAAGDLKLLVNTHHHSDHVGGNHVLQTRYALPVAAHAWEGRAVNDRHPEACLGRWLAQPVEAYTVNRLLREGDVIPDGIHDWEVIYTPGHSLGHVVLHCPELRVAVTGDALLPGDVGWLNFHRDGLGALEGALESLERLAGLGLRAAYPGHGPVVQDVPRAIEAAVERLEKFRADPLRMAWHGVKRIFVFALMIDGPMTQAQLQAYLTGSLWAADYARDVFQVTPDKFHVLLLEEMLRSGAARWHEGQLHAASGYRPSVRGWAQSPTKVTEWPRPA